MKEARLLHFSRKDDAHTFQFSQPTRKGVLVDMPLQQHLTEAKVLTESYETGLLEAITEVLGEGGILNGWQLYGIGKCNKNWDGVKNVNVIIVREKVEEAKDDGFRLKRETTSEWVHTPESSVISGQCEDH
ncbi:MAG: hypothetical protein Q9171_005897 [Xanthocarpia ochracea]